METASHSFIPDLKLRAKDVQQSLDLEKALYGAGFINYVEVDEGDPFFNGFENGMSKDGCLELRSEVTDAMAKFSVFTDLPEFVQRKCCSKESCERVTTLFLDARFDRIVYRRITNGNPFSDAFDTELEAAKWLNESYEEMIVGDGLFQHRNILGWVKSEWSSNPHLTRGAMRKYLLCDYELTICDPRPVPSTAHYEFCETALVAAFTKYISNLEDPSDWRMFDSKAYGDNRVSGSPNFNQVAHSGVKIYSKISKTAEALGLD